MSFREVRKIGRPGPGPATKKPKGLIIVNSKFQVSSTGGIIPVGGGVTSGPNRCQILNTEYNLSDFSEVLLKSLTWSTDGAGGGLPDPYNISLRRDNRPCGSTQSNLYTTIESDSVGGGASSYTFRDILLTGLNVRNLQISPTTTAGLSTITASGVWVLIP